MSIPMDMFWPGPTYGGSSNTSSSTSTSSNSNPATGKANELAEKYTKLWEKEIANLKGLYTEAGLDIEHLGDLEAKFAQEYDKYYETFGPLRDKFLEETNKDFIKKDELSQIFMDLATPDYAGVAGKAMADVSHQTDIGLKSLERGLTRMGTNPGGGNWLEMLRRARLDEAKNKVLAANTARDNEKDRVAGMATTGLQLFDPTKSANMAATIQQGGLPYLQGQGSLATNQAQLSSNLAGGYAQNVVSPYESAATGYQGIGLGLYGSSESNKEAITSSPSATQTSYLNPGFYDSISGNSIYDWGTGKKTTAAPTYAWNKDNTFFGMT